MKLFAWLLLFLTDKTFSLNSFWTTSLYKLEPDASFKWCKRCEKIAFIICQLSRILWQVELYYQRKSSKLIKIHLHARIFMPKLQCPNRPVGFQSRASRKSFLLRSFSKEIAFSRPKMLSSLVQKLACFVWRGNRWSLFE